jgi:uncharacterized protein
METQKKKIVIVTGASAGLGAEFARQLDQKYRGTEIWLIARRAEPMQRLASDFTQNKGVVISLDITKADDINKLEARFRSENVSVLCLVNNAGLGKIGPFAKLGRAEQLQMIDVNIRALTDLTYICLPFMPKGSAVIQVASSIAYCPSPNFAIYAATKSYVLSLTHALHYEFQALGIHVMAVCPGPVATEFFEVANRNEFSNTGAKKNPFNERLTAQPAAVVRKALRDLDKKKVVSIYGFPIKLFTLFIGLIPKWISMPAMAVGRNRTQDSI